MKKVNDLSLLRPFGFSSSLIFLFAFLLISQPSPSCWLDVVDIDECKEEPCWSAGTAGCVDLENDYQCVCNPRYTGRHCEAGKDIKLKSQSYLIDTHTHAHTKLS